MAKKPAPVATVMIYARVSQDPRGNGRSVEEQTAECLAWAKREGWAVTTTYSETGSASRYAGKSRLVWKQVMEAVSKHEADALLTWEASRAGRDLAGYTQLRDACARAGVKLGYSGTLYDLTSRDARFRTGLDALLAEDEAARTSERVQRAVRANAEAGKVHGKNLYGYRRVYDPRTRGLVAIEPHPEQAPIVAEIFERTLAGESPRQIAGDLNRRNVPPRRPAHKPDRATAGWTVEAVHEVAFERPAYAGLREYRGEILHGVETQWPALVDQQRWLDMQKRLPTGPVDRERYKAKHLLSGIARCGVCGHQLSASFQNTGRALDENGKHPRYISYGCQAKRIGTQGFHVSVAEHALDALVVEVVLARLSDPKAVARLVAVEDTRTATQIAEHAELLAENDADREWLEKVTKAAAEARDVGMLIEQRAIVLPRIAEREAKMRWISGIDPAVFELASADDIQGAWNRMDLQARRRVLSSAVAPIVSRAKKPGQRNKVHERVEIGWRF